LIYICIPTHNEQQTVGVVLWKLRQVLTDYPRDYQLLVADDGSTDKTAAVLEPYTRVLPLTVIHSDKQLGTAAATEMLLREAVRRSEYPKRDVVVTLQADFSEEPDDLVALIRRMEAGADVAIGNKVSVTRPTRSRVWARKLFCARPEVAGRPDDPVRELPRIPAVRDQGRDGRAEGRTSAVPPRLGGPGRVAACSHAACPPRRCRGCGRPSRSDAATAAGEALCRGIRCTRHGEPNGACGACECRRTRQAGSVGQSHACTRFARGRGGCGQRPRSGVGAERPAQRSRPAALEP